MKQRYFQDSLPLSFGPGSDTGLYNGIYEKPYICTAEKHGVMIKHCSYSHN